MARSVNPVPQYFDSAGKPLAFGKMFYFESGTSDLKDIFADTNGEIPIANPVELTASGRLPNVFFTGSVKQILTDKDDVQIFERDPVGSSNLEGSFEDWEAAKVYDATDLVTGPDGLYYQSITSNNQGNTPASFPTQWMRVSFVTQYNAAFSYSIGDVAIEGNIQFISKTDNNLNNLPSTDGEVNWENTSGTTAAMILLDTQIASASSTIEFSTGIDSTFSKYVIEILNAVPSALANVQIRTSSDGGSIFDFGATDYSWTKRKDSILLNSSVFTNNQGDTEVFVLDSLGVQPFDGTIALYNPSNAGTRTSLKFDVIEIFGADINNSFGAGSRNAAEVVDAIQFSLSTGNFTSGTFKLYGIT